MRALLRLTPALLFLFSTVAVADERQALNFCERFAAAAADKLIDGDAHYLTDTAAVTERRRDRVMMFVDNLLQPADSDFIGVWHCKFNINADGKTCTGEVGLPVAGNKAFADYTMWQRLNIVADNAITVAGVTGYITPKYYKLSCGGGN